MTLPICIGYVLFSCDLSASTWIPWDYCCSIETEDSQLELNTIRLFHLDFERCSANDYEICKIIFIYGAITIEFIYLLTRLVLCTCEEAGTSMRKATPRADMSCNVDAMTRRRIWLVTEIELVSPFKCFSWAYRYSSRYYNKAQCVIFVNFNPNENWCLVKTKSFTFVLSSR